MYSVGRSDAELSDVLSKAAGIAVDSPPPSAEELQKLIAEVAAHGNAARGEEIFRRADLSCMKCHSIARAGGQVGPELTAIGSISPVDYVANSILVPNLAVKEQFVTRVFVTSDGRTITGIVVDRNRERVNVRDASGTVVAIPTADIDEEEEGKSLMPQGLTKFLTRDELVDLVKFVSELGKPGAFEVRSVPTIQRRRAMKKVPNEIIADPTNVEYFREYVQDAPADAWQPAYGTARGDLPLQEFGKAGDWVLVFGEVNIVTAGDVSISVGPNSARVWIDAEPFDAAKTIVRRLSPGTHRVSALVKISDSGKSSLRVELGKSAESKAQFDVVGGS
ncbi:MAG: c-type cytochrome [Pirellulales bacterium]